jgi:anti-sigma regulatory factor (Ser/Thr protein kinase)
MATDGPSRRAAAPLIERTVAVPADPASLTLLHAGLASFWAAVEHVRPGAVDDHWRAHFETAIGEIAANIIRHAYPPDTPARPLRLRLRAYPTAIEARFVDRGQPPRSSPTPESGPTSTPSQVADLAEGGYGLALARAAVDELTYARAPAGGNVWRLVKRF